MNTAAIGYRVHFSAVELPSFHGDWRVGAAMLASLMVHGLALGWLPGLQRHVTEQEAPQPIHVRLATPAPEPAALAVPPTLTFPPPTLAAARRAPDPAPQRAAQVLASPAAASAPDSPAVREVAAPVAAPLEPPRPVPPAAAARPAVVDPAMLAAYGRELAGAVATQQRYPRIALLRQWQGTALLQLELAADGRLLGVRVLSSSGHDTLDRQALDMVRAALPLPAMPAALAGRPLTVEVPVVFRITS